MAGTKSTTLENLNRDGFVIIPSILTPEQISQLRTATEEVTSLARSGAYPHVRTLPKQFPPWTIPSGTNPAADGIWGVQGLMNPSLPHHGLFTSTYFSSTILSIVKELLQCTDDELVMELFNLLLRPDTDFSLQWHRDDIPASASAAEEIARLGQPAFHAQYNLCLCDDDSLIVIPGSHKRARTDIERDADPWEKELPGQCVVKLNAGDIVFYDNNILHTGRYVATKERMTLHGSVGHIGGGRVRARNVLQHGVLGCDLSGVEDEGDRKRAEGMWNRLKALADGSGDVGYSLQG